MVSPASHTKRDLNDIAIINVLKRLVFWGKGLRQQPGDRFASVKPFLALSLSGFIVSQVLPIHTADKTFGGYRCFQESRCDLVGRGHSGTSGCRTSSGSGRFDAKRAKPAV